MDWDNKQWARKYAAEKAARQVQEVERAREARSRANMKQQFEFIRQIGATTKISGNVATSQRRPTSGGGSAQSGSSVGTFCVVVAVIALIVGSNSRSDHGSALPSAKATEQQKVGTGSASAPPTLNNPDIAVGMGENTAVGMAVTDQSASSFETPSTVTPSAASAPTPASPDGTAGSHNETTAVPPSIQQEPLVFTHSVDAYYPSGRDRTQLPVSVRVLVAVAPDGMVVTASAQDVDPAIGHSAEQAALQWRFEPYVAQAGVEKRFAFITVNFDPSNGFTRG